MIDGQDLRYSLRALRKSPAVTGIAILALALGIGANTAIFTVVNAVLLRPLPYQDSERLVVIWQSWQKRGFEQTPVMRGDYLDWTRQAQSFDLLAGLENRDYIFTGAGEPERLRGSAVTSGFFPVLGAEPVLGRVFSADEDTPGRDQVAVISYGFWQRRFGGDPGIIGETLTLNGRQRTVIGVMPSGFRLVMELKLAGIFFPLDEVWVPLVLESEELRSGFVMTVLGRLKHGVTAAGAQAEMQTIQRRIEHDRAEMKMDLDVRVVEFHEQVVDDVRPSLVLLLAAVGLLLLIACANVANLLLARAAGRGKEFAIRAALGAGQMRITRQLLTESILLALVGGMMGLLLAFAATDILIAMSPEVIRRTSHVRIDLPVLLFTFAVSVAAGVLFGLAPAVEFARPRLGEALKEGGRGSTLGPRSGYLRRMLVVSEVALAMMLLIGAGLLIRSFSRLQSVETGIHWQGLLTMEMTLPASRYPDESRQGEFFRRVLGRLESLPGVQAAGVVSHLPFESVQELFFTIEGRPATSLQDRPIASNRSVSPDYFRTMQIPLRRGRLFEDRDTAEAEPVVIIDQTMAERYWPGQDPTGRRIKRGGPNSAYPWLTVVGVVGSVRQYGLDAEMKPGAYMPYLQYPRASMSLVLRSSSDPGSLASAVRAEARQIDRDQPLDKIRTMAERLSVSLASQRFSALLLAIFAGVALVMAAAGIYGVIAYSISQRVHEIGIRMALGALPADVVRLVVRQGMTVVGTGMLLGLAGALASSRLLSGLLFGVSSIDALVYVSVPALLGLVAFAACYFPARRATGVDPLVSLRHD